ncbi:MAG: hypothetical protein AB8B55_06065 [Mariniblastus sp.]
MPKPLQFEFGGEAIEFEMNKVDRSKLYGFKVVEVLDEHGVPCELTTLADDGKTLIGKGGTGIGYLSADGEWCDKSELKAVNLEGKEIVPVPSSFSAPVKLETEISIDEYLNHNIRLIYQLEPKTITETLHKKLNDGVIFKFPYSYRGGLEADAGILLMNDDDEVFFLVGDETSIEFKGLQQAAPVAPPEEEDDEADAGGLMDFGMI